MILHIHGKGEKNYTLSDSTEQSDEIEHGLTFELLLCFRNTNMGSLSSSLLQLCLKHGVRNWYNKHLHYSLSLSSSVTHTHSVHKKKQALANKTFPFRWAQNKSITTRHLVKLTCWLLLQQTAYMTEQHSFRSVRNILQVYIKSLEGIWWKKDSYSSLCSCFFREDFPRLSWNA